MGARSFAVFMALLAVIGLLGFPESFLIDPDGKVALIRRGPIDEEYLTRLVAPRLERQ